MSGTRAELRFRVAVSVPVTIMTSRVNGAMLVDDIDGLSLEGEFDMDGAFAVVSRHGGRPFPGFHLTCIAVLGLFFLPVVPTIPILETVQADILESGAITTLLVLGRALSILEPVSLLDGSNDGSIWVE